MSSIFFPLIAFAVIEAINTGIPGAVKKALTKIAAVTAVRALKNTAHLGRTPIMHAAARGDLELFNEVLREMRSRLTKEEVKCTSEPGWLVDMIIFSREHLICLDEVDIIHASLFQPTNPPPPVTRNYCQLWYNMQLSEALTTITGDSKETLLIAAAKGGNNEVFNVVVKLLHGVVRRYFPLPFISKRRKKLAA